MIKKTLFLFCCLVLLTAFQCEDEPLEGEFVTDSEAACLEAVQLVAATLQDFTNADADSYTTLCNTYKAALEAQIEACGDENGALQAAIDALGTCTDDNVPDLTCEDAIEASQNAAAALENATTDDAIAVACEAYKDALETQIAICGDEDGSLQALIDALGDCVVSSSNDSFFANVDGVEFVETQIDVAVVQASGVPDYISISATNADGAISLSIPITHAPGDYAFTTFLEADSVSGTYLVNDQALPAFPGTLTVISNENNVITGTFEFTAEPFVGGGDTYQITGGNFSVTY